MARLRIVSGDGVEQVVELRAQRVQIGRGRDNDVVLPDPEKGVSRTHAELRLENDRYVVVDLQSQNGTWLNGSRVERAEVPYGAELAVGGYRMTLVKGGDSSARLTPTASQPDPLDDMRTTGAHAPPAYRPSATPRPASGSPAPWAVALAVAILVIIALAATVWVGGWRPQSKDAASNGSSAAPTQSNAPADTPAPGRGPEGPVAPAVDRQADPPDESADPSRKGTKTSPERGATAAVPRVGRRPGESADAWRSRGAALQMRYEYSTAALTRGDFAAAAGGFEAILIEEPGFMDAAGLLVQAQSGMRASAQRLYVSGKKLDAAGDWVGALQKYEQARQIYAGVDGLPASLQQVRAKLRSAGTAAFKEGRQHEIEGRIAEAVKAYENAIQWLPSDDPNRQIARSRVEQLKKTIEGQASGEQ